MQTSYRTLGHYLAERSRAERDLYGCCPVPEESREPEREQLLERIAPDLPIDAKLPANRAERRALERRSLPRELRILGKFRTALRARLGRALRP